MAGRAHSNYSRCLAVTPEKTEEIVTCDDAKLGNPALERKKKSKEGWFLREIREWLPAMMQFHDAPLEVPEIMPQLLQRKTEREIRSILSVGKSRSKLCCRRTSNAAS